MQYKDLGHKVETASPVSKKEKYYPSISLNSEQISGLDNKKIGANVELKIIAVIKGMRKDKDKTSYELELKKCAIGKEMSYDEYKKLSPDEKDKHDKKEMGIEDEE